jgi:hypothetical protein
MTMATLDGSPGVDYFDPHGDGVRPQGHNGEQHDGADELGQQEGHEHMRPAG